MKTSATFYHAGCPVCVAAGQPFHINFGAAIADLK